MALCWLDQAEDTYGQWCIPQSDDKAETLVLDSSPLGCAIDGVEGTFRPPVVFLQNLISLSLVSVRERCHTLRWMQVLCGRWSRAFQFRKPSSGIFDQVWR